jgi:hypothetical protein
LHIHEIEAEFVQGNHPVDPAVSRSAELAGKCAMSIAVAHGHEKIDDERFEEARRLSADSFDQLEAELLVEALELQQRFPLAWRTRVTEPQEGRRSTHLLAGIHWGFAHAPHWGGTPPGQLWISIGRLVPSSFVNRIPLFSEPSTRPCPCK